MVRVRAGPRVLYRPRVITLPGRTRRSGGGRAVRAAGAWPVAGGRYAPGHADEPPFGYFAVAIGEVSIDQELGYLW